MAVIIAGIFLLYSRRVDKQTKLAYSVIAQLERGVFRQEELVAETRKVRANLQNRRGPAEGAAPKANRRTAAEDFERGSQRRVRSEKAIGRNNRALETRDERVGCRGRRDSILRAERLPADVSVVFKDQSSGRRLRYGGINTDGGPLKDSEGNPVYTLKAVHQKCARISSARDFWLGKGRF